MQVVMLADLDQVTTGVTTSTRIGRELLRVVGGHDRL